MEINKDFLIAGEQYLHTSRLLLDKMREAGNIHVVISEHDISWDDYEKATECSDFNIMIPTLFNLYHGIELIIKGMIKLYNTEFRPEHSFEQLLRDLQELEKTDTKYLEIIGKYINRPLGISFLNEYMNSEGITNVSELYMSLRYPTDRHFKKIYQYYSVRYKGRTILNDIEEMSNDISGILKSAVKVCHVLNC